MKYTPLLLVSMIMMSCLKEETYGTEYFYRDFFTNNDVKSWRINPGDIALESAHDTTCSLFSARSLDNTFKLHADYTLEFNNGDITSYPGCDSCCVDLPSGTGRWYLQDRGEDKLLVFIVNSTSGIADTLINANLYGAGDKWITLENADDNSRYYNYLFSLEAVPD
ncbi:hypothetical protein [Fulvivirga sediminis]|uniref:Uncharacterized protein n=1 Tax=Fulvivirga sediminis TaxID=2803949 RepID=A0A937F627_9BACT|nr:hypothetical protein [Fulvivirga sediminis]MBL3655657.1 hypothetical protein [Fulvivirga sediminis]